MANNEYNPDVLHCIANLSNDEVFTPPTLANQVLDMLPQELFCDPTTTFIDPFCKSGVFLREIVKRLDRGLAEQIPDRQKRIDHIMHHQVYGIALTELTSLLSRRTLYCSKKANSPHSVSYFENEQGNVQYKAIKHTWVNGKCKYCGANQDVYDRGTESEQYAYQFIHTDKPEKLFPKDMKFDVIIGNPPYQLSTAGEENGAQAKPLYHLFIEQAKKLNPRYLSMIIPARWYSGGWGLDDFRKTMISENKISILHDFVDSKDCFSGVDIKGGVCFFLWEKNYSGPAKIFTHENMEVYISDRKMKEKGCDIFIRMSQAIPILHKVQSYGEKTFDSIVSTKKPFGMTTNYHGNPFPFDNAVKLYANKRIDYICKNEVSRNVDYIEAHKLIIPKAVGSGDAKTDVIKPIYCEPNSVCTETYLLVGPFRNKEECTNVISYIDTRFFHLLVTLQKNTQDCMRKVYSFVPLQDFSHPWTDEMLYEKYGLDEKEIAFIESMIRPME